VILDAVREEMADILIYLLRLSDVLAIDLDAAVRAKIAINAEKYPAELSKGNATKYNRRSR
jgi:NTP pyrophosphatase (non-canonical NTP hydrolase)